MNKVLGLDLATKTGWAVITKDNSCGGTWKLNKKSKDHEFSRPYKLLKNLETLYEEHPDIDIVGWEHVQFVRYRLAYAIYNQLVGAAKVFVAKYNLPVELITTNELKQYATGNSKASKEELKVEANKIWPNTSFDTDDEVDARFVAHKVASKLKIATPLR